MKVIRLLLCGFLCFATVITFCCNKGDGYTDKHFNTQEYQCVLNLWHVDTFEGGSGSRKQFLLSVARQFEKQHKGVLVTVSSYSVQGVNLAFENNQFPDVISYGIGVNLANLTTLKVDKVSKGGVISNKCYATEWCRGGYCLVTKKPSLVDLSNDFFEQIIISKGEFTQPYLAVGLEGITAKEIIEKPPLDAYINFVNSQNSVFLCTQRDLVRLANRGIEVDCRPLTAYNDLIQYVSVTTTNAVKNALSNQFVKLLLSQKVQLQLQNINMLSASQNITFQTPNYQLLQQVDWGNSLTLSVLTKAQTLSQLNQCAKQLVLGEKSMMDKIKNLLI